MPVVAAYGIYTIAIAVDPTDPNLVYVGGLSAYRATVAPSGPSFTMTPVGLANVHADVHTIVHGHGASPGSLDATNVWIGCDGGLWHSSASGSASSFHAADEGIAVTELNFIAQRHDTDALVYGA